MNQPSPSVQLSQFLSLVLRHKPETIGIELSPQGWAEIGERLCAAQLHGVHLEHNGLLPMVRVNGEQRFTIRSDGTSIRANLGHSIQVDLGLK